MEHTKTAEEIVTVMRSREKKDADLIRHTYTFAEHAHHGQKRYSGDPYFVHVANVGFILAEMGMDATTISAGLLHDTVEDAKVSEEDIEREFGPEIRFLVDGVTKLGKLKYHGVERHVESLRKLFVSTAKDLRVIIIKLADRLHNVSTLKHVPKEKQRRIALETLEIYAPIANRLSIGRIKGQLEDYAFPFAYPEQYEKLQELLKENRANDNEKKLEKIYRGIQVELAKGGIMNVHGEFRIKRMYSLYKKLSEHGMDLSKIYDLSAIRVIVPTLADCYRALGIVHSVWQPLPGRIKDYIAFPKPNGYQSLHTTVFTGDGAIVEVQFRTEDMNREAAFGIAAHFAYKETIPHETNKKLSQKLGWVKQISQLQQHNSGSGEYLENLKVDFFGDRIFLFTPKGDVVDLPQKSSPIDFAYAIHSDIGEHTSGAIVNGKFVALDTSLHNGDIVEIITKKNARPSPKWVEYAKTTFAKNVFAPIFKKKKESDADSRHGRG